jgi:hypothetical protein
MEKEDVFIWLGMAILLTLLDRATSDAGWGHAVILAVIIASIAVILMVAVRSKRSNGS